MSGPVRLSIEGGSVLVGRDGLGLCPWFSSTAAVVRWDQVMFVCAVPGVQRDGLEWRTYRGEPITPETLRDGLPFYELAVALHDRHAVAAPMAALHRWWFRAALGAKPLHAADDRPHATNGWFEMYLRRRWVRRSGVELVRALDLVDRHCRFDIIVMGS